MHDLKAVSTLFDLRGDFVHGYSYGSGHINDTYCIWVDQAGQRIRYILQRVNHNVFKQPIPLMENVKRVTDHALKRLKEEGKLVIISTHIMSEAEKLCDRIGVIIDGRKVMEGHLEDILRETQTEDLEDAFFELYSQVKGGGEDA